MVLGHDAEMNHLDEQVKNEGAAKLERSASVSRFDYLRVTA
jgi:hypothetical protein